VFEILLNMFKEFQLKHIWLEVTASHDYTLGKGEAGELVWRVTQTMRDISASGYCLISLKHSARVNEAF
ncbi:hypothetical protein PMAYCL1PPCAC_25385, partial [Pristionchus mayeri]